MHTTTHEWIDSHCHLTYEGLHERIETVLALAREVGVREMVTIATDLEDARSALALSDRFPEIHVSVGIHPHQAGKLLEATANSAEPWDAQLGNLLSREDVFAVGETGLDYHYDFADRATQAAVFRAQLRLAQRINKPVVIHCREAIDDTLEILAEHENLRGVVFHCFTGTRDEAERILERGYWVSLTGVVTFKRSDELREVARMIPADRLMVETDSPYLSPEPVRAARPNEPAHVVHTAACIAAARGLEINELSKLTVANTRRFFGLPTLN